MEGEEGGDGDVPPEAPPPSYSKVTEKPGKAVDTHDQESKTLAKKMSSIRKMTLADGERVEVDKTALEAILDVSSRIAGVQRRTRLSMSTLVAHESPKD